MSQNLKFNGFEEFFKLIRVRVKYHNKNWLAVITGDTGSGKSYSALTIARKISNNIHIVFNPVDFMKLIESDNIKKNDVIIFDEAGVGLSSREWYSLQNKILGRVLQTFRNMNLAVIFTTPDLSFIDVQARKLFHHYFETKTINYEINTAYLKVFKIDVNGRYNKTYFVYPTLKFKNRIIKLRGFGVKKPNEKMIEYYEGLKTDYTKKLNKEALAGLTDTGTKKSRLEILKEKRIKELEDLTRQVIENKEKYICKDTNKILTSRVASFLHLSDHKARVVKVSAQNKLGLE